MVKRDYKRYIVRYNKKEKAWAIRFKEDGVYKTVKFTSEEEANKFREEKLNKPNLKVDLRWEERLINYLLEEMNHEEILELNYNESDIWEENLKYALEQVTPREKKVIEEYFKGLTLEKIGEYLGVTRERARQILIKGLKRIFYRRYTIFTKKDLRALNEEFEEVFRERRKEIEELRKMDIATVKEKYGEELATKSPIEELLLSVRSYNCLKRAKIDTIEELTEKTEEEMMKIRNLGRKSLREIIRKLEEIGLGLKESEFFDNEFSEDEDL